MPNLNWDSLDKRVARALAQIQSAGEKRLLLAYAQALKEIRTKMSRLYQKVKTPDGKLTLAEMTKYNRYATLDKEISDLMRDTYKIAVGDIDRIAEEVYEASYFRYAWAFDQHAQVSLSWGLINRDAIAAATGNPLDLIAKNTLEPAMRNRIRTAITQGLIQGKSYPKMMREIMNAMGNNAYEAMRIARTEGQRAQSLGTEAIYDVARKNGIAGREIWDATLDGRTRPSHQALDGQARGEDGLWRVSHNGEMLETPGPVLSGVASFDINCRCRRRFEVEGFAPIIRRTRDGGIIPYTTYDDWRERLDDSGAYIPTPEQVDKIRA